MLLLVSLSRLFESAKDTTPSVTIRILASLRFMISVTITTIMIKTIITTIIIIIITIKIIITTTTVKRIPHLTNEFKSLTRHITVAAMVIIAKTTTATTTIGENNNRHKRV